MRIVLLAISLLVAAGCATAPRPAPELVTAEEQARLPANVERWVQRLRDEGERNAVRNLTEVAANAMQAQQAVPEDLRDRVIDDALDAAMMRIEAIYADTPEANRARSVWHAESSKDFKGEPYERVYPFLLRGLRYYETGDIANARACFLTAILQDSLAVEGEFQADWATLEYLTSLCHIKLGNETAAAEAFERARNLGVVGPPPNAADNLLIIAMAGRPPLKLQGGQYKQILVYAPGELATASVVAEAPWVRAEKQARLPDAADDIFYQATTRGGRAVDEINKRKAVIKEGTDVASNLAIIGGAITLMHGHSDEARLVGAGLVVVGFAAAIIGSAIQTRADVRTLPSLPSRLYAWSGQCPPGNQTIELRYRTKGGEQKKISETVPITAEGNPTVELFRLP